MSHDVDWRKQGASIEHIFTRKERFDKETLEKASIKNPYYNIPDIMNLEDKFGIRSTFFLGLYMRVASTQITKMILGH